MPEGELDSPRGLPERDRAYRGGGGGGGRGGGAAVDEHVGFGAEKGAGVGGDGVGGGGFVGFEDGEVVA